MARGGSVHVSSHSSFVFRYSHGNEPQYIPAAIPQQGTVNSTITHQALLGHTWVIGPNKVNEFKLGFSKGPACLASSRSLDR